MIANRKAVLAVRLDCARFSITGRMRTNFLRRQGSQSIRACWVLILLMGFGISACGPIAFNNKLYATSEKNCKPAKRIPIKPCIIEFDDDGYARDTSQLNQALAYMDAAYSAASTGPGDARKVLTLVYFHGWNHNAQPGDSDLKHFEKLAHSLRDSLHNEAKNINDSASASQPIQRDTSPIIVPIYMAWRGRSAPRPAWWNTYVGPEVWHYLFTFWGRKAAAERVGRGAAAMALTQISSKWRSQVQSVALTNPIERPTLVLVGHSFGGAALLNSTLTAIAGEGRTNGHLDADGTIADLVIAINPAIEASSLDKTVRSLKLDTDSAKGDGISRLLVIDAEDDWARKFAFPVGRFLGGLLRTSDHWVSERLAAGRVSEQRGYSLRPDSAAKCTRYKSAFLCPEKDSVPPRNTAMIVQVKSTFGVGHNNIWQPVIVDFISQFVIEQQKVRMNILTKMK